MSRSSVSIAELYKYISTIIKKPTDLVKTQATGWERACGILIKHKKMFNNWAALFIYDITKITKFQESLQTSLSVLISKQQNALL